MNEQDHSATDTADTAIAGAEQPPAAAGMWGALVTSKRATAAAPKPPPKTVYSDAIRQPRPGAHVLAFNLDNPLQCIGPFASIARAHAEIRFAGWNAADVYECEYSDQGHVLGERLERVDLGPRPQRAQRSARWNQTVLRHEHLRSAAEAMQMWHVLNVDELRLILQAAVQSISPSAMNASFVPDDQVLKARESLQALIAQLPDPHAALRPRLAPRTKRASTQSPKLTGVGTRMPGAPAGTRKAAQPANQEEGR